MPDTDLTATRARVRERLLTDLRRVTSAATAAAADGKITLAEACGVVYEFCANAVFFADFYGEALAGPDKKALVTETANMLFDSLWSLVTPAAGFSWLRWIPGSVVRAGFLSLVDGAIEAACRRRVKTPTPSAPSA